jgi:hypothetical protein
MYGRTYRFVQWKLPVQEGAPSGRNNFQRSFHSSSPSNSPVLDIHRAARFTNPTPRSKKTAMAAARHNWARVLDDSDAATARLILSVQMQELRALAAVPGISVDREMARGFLARDIAE